MISLIEDANERSARVAEKLGMTVEGRTRIVDEQFEVRIFGTDLGSRRGMTEERPRTTTRWSTRRREPRRPRRPASAVAGPTTTSTTTDDEATARSRRPARASPRASSWPSTT